MTNEMMVTGRILNLEEKKASTGSFYMVDLETFYGPNIRFQAWGNAYDFIKRNQLRSADKSGNGGDYIDVKGYTHNYIMENKQGQRNQYVTFKSQEIKRPAARVTYSGYITNIGSEEIEVLSGQTGFLFTPDTPFLDYGSWQKPQPIHCVIEDSNIDAKYLQFLADRPLGAIIIGQVDNTNKRLTKVFVEHLELCNFEGVANEQLAKTEEENEYVNTQR